MEELRSSRRSALIGRDAEVERIQAAVDHLTAGIGRLVLISGEPGVGKTRLVEELAAFAVDQGAWVAWGRVDDLDGAPPYWPWVQVLERVLGSGDPQVIGDALRLNPGPLAAILPAVSILVPELPVPPALDPAAARFRLHQAVVDLLVAVAAHQPLVLILDDMHWADVSSLELARFVAARLDGAPVLLAFTYRDVDSGRSAPFDEVLAALARAPAIERIALSGLTEPEVGRFMAQTIGLRPRPGVVSAVYARTEGNPFFAGELARLLQSEGLLRAGVTDTHDRVPVGVRDVIRRRLLRLPEPTNDMLVLAAALGREFDLGGVAATAETGVGDAVDALEPAVSAGLLCEVAGAARRLRFSHALVRDAIYGELTALRRATVHAKVGAALERRGAGAPAHLAELARHFLLAAPVLGPDPGLSYALRAAEAAEGALSHERAEDELRRALSLVELMAAGSARAEKELEVQNRLVALMVLTRGFAAPEVGRACARARELCREMGDTDALFKALNNLANFHHIHGDLGLAMELGGQLLTIGRQRSKVMWLTAGHLFLGMAQLHAGMLPAARDSLASLRELAAGLELSSDVADAFFGLHPLPMGLMYSARSAWTLGETVQAAAFAREGLSTATLLEHPHTLAFASYFDTHLRVISGDVPAVRAASDRGIAFCQEHGLSAYQGWFRLFRGWAASQEGNAEDGVREMAAQTAANRASGARINNPFFLGLLADGHARCADPVRALALVEEALGAIGEDRLWEADLRRRRGELLAAQGPEHRAAAAEALAGAVALAAAQGAVPFTRRAQAALTALEATEDGRPGPGAPAAMATNLSLRERELLGLLAGGLTDKEIAAALVISLATVRSHLDRIRDKTGRRRRPELTRLAIELGLVAG